MLLYLQEQRDLRKKSEQQDATTGTNDALLGVVTRQWRVMMKQKERCEFFLMMRESETRRDESPRIIIIAPAHIIRTKSRASRTPKKFPNDTRARAHGRSFKKVGGRDATGVDGCTNRAMLLW